ncbi:MAG TPA: DUF2157 domain-containing protein [Bacteroidia bacterium]|jgi:hypothetical protein|nr:DUF2157 domain-containing protein [Bacteroidia bacterium]
MSPTHTDLADEALAGGLISPASHVHIKARSQGGLFSIHGELNTILYAGVLALSTGLGMLVYNNIEHIGHLSIMAAIALVSAGSFYYCFRRAGIFSKEKTESADRISDYLALLGALTLVTLFGYVQYQYNIFGPYGLQFLIPSLFCLFAGYYLDHLGVLSAGITSFGAFLGLAISPMSRGMYESFNTEKEVGMGLLLGALLLGAGFLTQRKKIKTHFAFTYYHFALHVSFFAAIAGIFEYPVWGLIVPVLAFITWRAMLYALTEKSFYFFLVTLIYAYVAVCCLYAQLVMHVHSDGEAIFMLTFFLLIASSVAVISIIRSFWKKINRP